MVTFLTNEDKAELEAFIGETANTAFVPFEFNTIASGKFVMLDDVSEEKHNPLIKLKSDSITDFSNTTVRVCNKNLIPKLYEGSSKRDVVVSGFHFEMRPDYFITFYANCTATEDISYRLVRTYLPKGTYTFSGTWTSNSGQIAIQAKAEDGTVATFTDTSGGVNVVKELTIVNSVGQYYDLTIEIPKDTTLASKLRVWALQLEMGSVSTTYVEGVELQTCKSNSLGLVTELKSESPEMLVIADNDVDVFVACNKVEPVYRCGLPVLEISGDTSGMDKDNAVQLNYTYKGTSGTCTLKWQGSSSLAYPKKNYTIKFDNAFEAVSGWGSQKKYCLKANYIDHSHARNVVSAKLWGQIVKSRTTQNETLNSLVNGGAIDGFPVVIKLNGEFHGLYTFNIPKDGWMLGMSEDSATPQAFICAGNADAVTRFRDANSIDLSTNLELEFKSDNFSEEAIESSLSNLIAQTIDADTNGLTDQHPLNSLIDWESAIDYYIFTVLVGGLDMYAKNYILATYDGTKWLFSAYDMDSTYGLNWDGASFVPASQYRTTFKGIAESHTLMKVIYEQKTDALVARYNQLRSNLLSAPSVALEFDNFGALIPNFVFNRDTEKWCEIPSSAISNNARLVSWYQMRCEVIDKLIETLTQ